MFWPAWDLAFKEYQAADGTNYMAEWAKVSPHFQVIVEHVAVFEQIKAVVAEAQGIQAVVGHHVLFRTLELYLTLLSCKDAQEIKILQYNQAGGAPTEVGTWVACGVCVCVFDRFVAHV